MYSAFSSRDAIYDPLENILRPNVSNKIEQQQIGFRRDLHNNIVDWDVNEFDEKANEAHDAKTDGSSKSDLLEFQRNKR